MSEPRPDSVATLRILNRIEAGDMSAVNDLISRHRRAIREFIALRLDPRIQAIVDPSDVAQDVLTQMTKRLDDFLKRRPMPFQLWIRKAAYEQTLKARRKHFAECRDKRREAGGQDKSSLALINSIVASTPSPSEQLQAREFAERVGNAVAALKEDHREILMLRQVDDLQHKEIALLLDISEVNVRKRYGRALIELQKEMKRQGIVSGSRP